MVKKIPDEYHSITPYLILSDASAAIEFYKRAFGATEEVRMDGPDGTIGHAEIQIGDSRIMLADENAMTGGSARTLGGSPVSLLLYVEDSDAQIERAVKAGASVVVAAEDKFYGDRAGTIADPFGNQWHIHTHAEDVSPEEMERRMAAMAPAS